MRQVPKCTHVLHSLSSVLDTGVGIYKYEKLQYSPLHTPHCVPQRPVLGQAKILIDQEEVLNKVLIDLVIQSLRLSISLRMECSGHLSFNAQ